MLATTTPSVAQRLDQAGHAEARGGVELERIERSRNRPGASSTSSALQAGDGADVEAAVADREIVALDQQEAEIAGESGLLEIGLAVAARREQADARLVAIGAARAGRRETRRRTARARSTFIDL